MNTHVDSMLIDAKAAACMLGVDQRTMYDLAAPYGSIPCYRFGSKCIRFAVQDILDYKAACRCEPIVRTAAAQALPVRVQRVSISGPQNCFQKLGIVTRPKRSAVAK